MQTAEFKWLKQKHIFSIGDKVKLDLGCGNRRYKDFIGVDMREIEGTVRYNLETPRWPFVSDYASVILASHIIEHLDPSCSINFMNECWRVLELNGLLVVIVPYAGSEGYYQDPTHKNPWNRYTPFYFIPGNDLYDVYKPKQWTMECMNYNLETDMGFALRKIENISKEKEKEVREKWHNVTMAAKSSEPDMVVESIEKRRI